VGTFVCDCFKGFRGSKCEYGDSTTCMGRGTVSDTGSCKCNLPYTGDRCDTAHWCNEHGKFDGTHCICTQTSLDNYYNGPDCQYSAKATCNGKGKPNLNGTCTCAEGFEGPHCEYSNAGTCGSRGMVKPTGACVCNPPYVGTHCQWNGVDECHVHGKVIDEAGNCKCDPGFAGNKCQYSDKYACNSNGGVQNDGSCACTPGNYGAHCELSGDLCRYHGVPRDQNTCACDPQYVGKNCAECAPGYRMYKESNKYYASCIACPDCGAHGKCDVYSYGDNFHACRCDIGYTGPNCQYSRAATCSGHGEPNAQGVCACDRGYAGQNYGGTTVGCWSGRPTTCNNHGDPDPVSFAHRVPAGILHPSPSPGNRITMRCGPRQRAAARRERSACLPPAANPPGSPPRGRRHVRACSQDRFPAPTPRRKRRTLSRRPPR